MLEEVGIRPERDAFGLISGIWKKFGDELISDTDGLRAVIAAHLQYEGASEFPVEDALRWLVSEGLLTRGMDGVLLTDQAYVLLKRDTSIAAVLHVNEKAEDHPIGLQESRLSKRLQKVQEENRRLVARIIALEREKKKIDAVIEAARREKEVVLTRLGLAMASVLGQEDVEVLVRALTGKEGGG